MSIAANGIGERGVDRVRERAVERGEESGAPRRERRALRGGLAGFVGEVVGDAHEGVERVHGAAAWAGARRRNASGKAELLAPGGDRPAGGERVGPATSLAEPDADALADAERRLAGRGRVGDLDDRFEHAGVVAEERLAGRSASAGTSRRRCTTLPAIGQPRVGVVEDRDLLAFEVRADAVGEVGLDLGADDPRPGRDRATAPARACRRRACCPRRW